MGVVLRADIRRLSGSSLVSSGRTDICERRSATASINLQLSARHSLCSGQAFWSPVLHGRHHQLLLTCCRDPEMSIYSPASTPFPSRRGRDASQTTSREGNAGWQELDFLAVGRVLFEI